MWMFSTTLASIVTFQLIPVNELISVVVAVVMGLCLISSAIIYGKIYITMRRYSKEINGLQVPQLKARNGELANDARQRKSAVGTFFLYLVFFICYLPEYCRLLLSISLHNPHATPMLKFYYFSWTLVFLNSSLNPLVYCWKMRDIRRAIMNTLRSIFFKPQGNGTTLNNDEDRSNTVLLALFSRHDT